MMAIYAAHKPRFAGGVLTAQWRPWATKRWRWSTTIGYAIIYQPDVRTASGPPSVVEEHERVHVRQVEDLMLLSLVVGLVVFAVTGNWLLGLLLWLSGGAWQLPAFLTSAVRHGFNINGLYRSNEHERSARAQTQRWCHGKSWMNKEEIADGYEEISHEVEMLS
jgi:hypothetical protein